MNITIDDIGAIIPRQRKHKAPKLGLLAKKTLDRYRKAYKRVYGIYPEVKFDGTWFRIKGERLGVKRMRLKELAEQLEYRAGDSDG